MVSDMSKGLVQGWDHARVEREEDTRDSVIGQEGKAYGEVTVRPKVGGQSLPNAPPQKAGIPYSQVLANRLRVQGG